MGGENVSAIFGSSIWCFGGTPSRTGAVKKNGHVAMAFVPLHTQKHVMLAFADTIEKKI